MTEEEVPDTTFLKWVVIILGVLIIAVAIAIGVILYKRATKLAEKVSEPTIPQPAGEASTLPNQVFGEITIEAPQGLAAQSIMTSGNRLLVTYGDDQGRPLLIVVIEQNT
ncbi:MAG: hypothetical protein MI743_20005, partial [Sneathiellales bacterium]|nr:hypothetical protein [Sneathiellales bacterium]